MLPILRNYNSITNKSPTKNNLQIDLAARITKLKEDPKCNRIRSFKSDQPNKYPSAQSNNNYEVYMGNYMEKIINGQAVEKILDDQADKGLLNAIKESLKESKEIRTLSLTQSDHLLSLNFLLPSKYINTRLWDIIKNNSRRFFLDLLEAKYSIMLNSIRLKLDFVERLLETGDLYSNLKKGSKGPQVYYICSLLDKISFIRVSEQHSIPTLIYRESFDFNKKREREFRAMKLTFSEEMEGFINLILRMCDAHHRKKIEAVLIIFVYEVATGGNGEVNEKFKDIIKLLVEESKLSEIQNPNPGNSNSIPAIKSPDNSNSNSNLIFNRNSNPQDSKKAKKTDKNKNERDTARKKEIKYKPYYNCSFTHLTILGVCLAILGCPCIYRTTSDQILAIFFELKEWCSRFNEKYYGSITSLLFNIQLVYHYYQFS